MFTVRLLHRSILPVALSLVGCASQITNPFVTITGDSSVDLGVASDGAFADVSSDATTDAMTDATTDATIDVADGAPIFDAWIDVIPVTDVALDGDETCVPTTCEALNYNCGTAADQCGHEINCGMCLEGDRCGGGGIANVCGAPPTVDGCVEATCMGLGFLCGDTSDGCGHVLDCGSCVAPLTCGGGGTAHACGIGGALDGGVFDATGGCGPLPGCCPLTCIALGVECGVAGDGCGGELHCGDCPSGQVCGRTTAGQCG
jgi:hypothetical protein